MPTLSPPTLIRPADRAATARDRATPGRWPTATRAVQRAARAVLHARLAGLRDGRLRIVDRDGARHFGRPTAGFPVDVTVEVTDARAYWAALVGGSAAIGEQYVAGAWRTDDLVGLTRLIARNRAVMDGLDRRPAAAAALAALAALRPLRRPARLLRATSRAASRRDVAAHYDLGDDFFALFLDESMTYSCALYPRPDASLAEAQRAKYERVCDALELGPGDRVIEIGTGWGGFAVHAAATRGCRVTTTTVSARQRAAAVARVAAAGLTGRVEVRGDDYRDLRGTHDKLVSIEMIEAVGRAHLGRFFTTVARLLVPDGQALIQAIVIADQAFERAAADTDFVKRHVFPGSCIPSVTALIGAATRHSDLRVRALDDLTRHYPPTLAAWRARLTERADRARALGFDDATLRAWDYYFATCEGGFRERYLGNVHLHLVRPAWRDPG